VALRLRHVEPIFKKNVVANELKWFAMSMFVVVMMALVLGLFCYAEVTADRTILAGTFFTLFEYLRRMTDSFFGFADKYGRIVSQSANIMTVEPIFEAGSSLVVGTQAMLPSAWQELDITGLSFAYAGKDDQQHFLRDVSLTLRRGRSIAFVGESGSGKSTLLSVLRGLHRADSAKVRCDGIRLPSGLQQVSQCTTLIPQEPEIFASTIRFNVSMGLDASDAEVMSAIRLARFEAVLAKLPRGLDTDIAEKGVNLSGGEKQRLALARGIFFAQQSSLVLLDEPTSSVDVFNERVIYKNILALFRDRCVISAVHKFHLLPMFDEIFVFAQGRLVERGTFDDLIAAKGELHRLWSSHALDGTEVDTEVVSSAI
jgi:ABC-type multidrug transport system fused ATPase/permease subunit